MCQVCSQASFVLKLEDWGTVQKRLRKGSKTQRRNKVERDLEKTEIKSIDGNRLNSKVEPRGHAPGATTWLFKWSVRCSL